MGVGSLKISWRGPLIISLLLTVLLIFFTHHLFREHDVEVVYYQKMLDDFYFNYFNDLDGDGIDERILLAKSENRLPNYIIYENIHKIVDQYNFSGEIIREKGMLSFGDYDGNGLKEIYFFITENDSLFLYATEYKSNLKVLDRRFITRAIKINKEFDFSIQPAGSCDLNQDGYSEFIFSFYAMFAKQPRCIFSLDIKNDTLQRTPLMGIPIRPQLIIDFDSDGVYEIFGGNYAPGNYDPGDSIPYTDQSAWFMVFDNQLSFKRPPLEVQGYTSRASIDSVWIVDDVKVLPFFQRMRQGDHYDWKISLLTPDWNMKDSLIFREELTERCNLYVVHDKLFILKSNTLTELGIDLKEKRTITINSLLKVGIIEDIDNDQIREFFFQHINYSDFLIVDDTFKKITFTIPTVKSTVEYVELFRNDAGESFISLISGKDWHIVQVSDNKWFHLQYPIYAGIFILISLIVRVGGKYRMYRREAFEKQVTELQLKALRNQIDPHFTFNVINSIGASIMRDEKEKSLAYFSKFSKLLRTTLQSSSSMFVPLEEELEVVRNYIELEKLRFKEKFQYRIDIDAKVDTSIPFPRMLLQMQVENAIKHGLQNSDVAGLLEIFIRYSGKQLILIVQDNGIGRERARSISNGTGSGQSLTNSIVELYNKISRHLIAVSVEDVGIRNGESYGTRVIIKLPIANE